MYPETSGENELVEIRKRAISVLEDEWHITLKNDKQWRQFFQDNAKTAIAKLQKGTEGCRLFVTLRFSVPAISVVTDAPMPDRS